MTARTGRRPLVAGNWKMNLNHLEAIALVQALAFSLSKEQLEAVEVVVLPPFTDLRSVQTLVDADRLAIAYGGQDLSPHSHGAHTGDVSGAMLAKLGCTHVVVGHSERRADHGETDDVVAAKTRAAFAADLVPIVCVGEGLEQREAGRAVETAVAQLDAAVGDLDREQAGRLVLAYEPVWAIGTGRTATPEQAGAMHRFIRKLLASFGAGMQDVAVIYGGSVKPELIDGLARTPGIDGALVGGASLDATQFVQIVGGVAAVQPQTSRSA